MKPPMNSTIVLLMYDGAISLPGMMPSRGKKTSGSSAVANSGIAWVIHQMAISAATAARRLAGSLPGSMGNTVSSTNTTTPRASPVVRVLSEVFGPTGAVAWVSMGGCPYW